MIKLYDNGVYLLNGTEIVESPEEAKARTGKEVSREEAAQQTMQIPAATAEALAAMIAAKTARSQADMEDSPDAKDSDNLKESGTGERQPSGISDRGTIELDSNFWEISDDISKMTITDIFGPDAHRIIEEGRKQNAADTAAQNAADFSCKRRRCCPC